MFRYRNAYATQVPSVDVPFIAAYGHPQFSFGTQCHDAENIMRHSVPLSTLGVILFFAIRGGVVNGEVT